jgi:hypothetical protein
MSIKSMNAVINGQTVTLNYNSNTGYWEASTSAPSTTSWGQTNHKYGISVTATDEAGNATTIDRSDTTFGENLQLRVLEKVKPTITVQAPTEGAFITSNKPTIKWTVTDTASGIDSSTISVKIDDQTTVTSGITATATTDGYTCSYTPSTALGEGAHTLRFNVSDNDGNAATEVTVTFKVDTVPPTLTVTTPTDQSYSASTAVVVSGTTNDATSSPVTVTVQVGSGTAQSVTVNSDGSFSTSVTCVEGSNTITITATDAAGKITTVTRTVTVDTKAPVFVEVSVTPNPVDAGATYVIKVKATDA